MDECDSDYQKKRCLMEMLPTFGIHPNFFWGIISVGYRVKSYQLSQILRQFNIASVAT
jgi:hypothetical protein